MLKPEQLLVGTNLCMTVKGRRLLDHVSFELDRGRILTVIGPNGAGKTTLVRIALGLLRPTHGHVEKARNLKVGYMPQKLSLPDSMPLSAKRFLTLSEHDTDKVAASAADVGVSHLLDRPMQALSGGETQRVLLARALLGDPNLLVLDEPVQGIDVNGQTELYALIMRLRDQRGCAVMMVSHDLHLVMASTDEVLCINQHVCCSGHPDTVSQHPAYLDLFGTAAADTLAVYTHHHDHTHNMHGDVVCDEDRHDHG